MDGKTPRMVEEQDIRDWVIISGAITEKELAKKFSISRKDLKPVVSRLEKDGVVKTKKKLFNPVIHFDSSSEQGRKELSSLIPSVAIVDEKKVFRTNLDILKNLVDRFGSIELSKIARFLKTNSETVESWAKMLHSQGLIVLFYPLVGEPILTREGEKHGVVNRTLVKYLTIALLILLAIYKRDILIQFLKKWLSS
ncbi:MAG: hypothetical protein FJY77_04230 [Candidatus Altiarchaeales archaeon]|nr:hypothetical protein [Candidatus Altiarchaeales archaeon]